MAKMAENLKFNIIVESRIARKRLLRATILAERLNKALEKIKDSEISINVKEK